MGTGNGAVIFLKIDSSALELSEKASRKKFWKNWEDRNERRELSAKVRRQVHLSLGYSKQSSHEV